MEPGFWSRRLVEAKNVSIVKVSIVTTNQSGSVIIWYHSFANEASVVQSMRKRNLTFSFTTLVFLGQLLPLFLTERIQIVKKSIDINVFWILILSIFLNKQPLALLYFGIAGSTSAIQWIFWQIASIVSTKKIFKGDLRPK